jgi:hypothetical protein
MGKTALQNSFGHGIAAIFYDNRFAMKATYIGQ